MIYRLGDDRPEIHGYVAPTAQIIGKVRILEDASVWMGAVLRGDIEAIVLGRGSNVQENSSLHTSHGIPLEVGENVTVGHSVTLHSCSVGDNCLIGMGATVLDGAEIGAGSLVAAGALVTPNTKFPENSFILGAPAKRHKEVGAAARAEIISNGRFYLELA
ncbi:MAG: gamma carbonic anhydrase family protein, partial [Spirochaetota bacterium]